MNIPSRRSLRLARLPPFAWHDERLEISTESKLVAVQFARPPRSPFKLSHSSCERIAAKFRAVTVDLRSSSIATSDPTHTQRLTLHIVGILTLFVFIRVFIFLSLCVRAYIFSYIYLYIYIYYLYIYSSGIILYTFSLILYYTSSRTRYRGYELIVLRLTRFPLKPLVELQTPKLLCNP